MQKETHLVCYQITVSSVALIGLKTMAQFYLSFQSQNNQTQWRSPTVYGTISKGNPQFPWTFEADTAKMIVKVHTVEEEGDDQVIGTTPLFLLKREGEEEFLIFGCLQDNRGRKIAEIQFHYSQCSVSKMETKSQEHNQSGKIEDLNIILEESNIAESIKGSSRSGGINPSKMDTLTLGNHLLIHSSGAPREEEQSNIDILREIQDIQDKWYRLNFGKEKPINLEMYDFSNHNSSTVEVNYHGKYSYLGTSQFVGGHFQLKNILISSEKKIKQISICNLDFGPEEVRQNKVLSISALPGSYISEIKARVGLPEGRGVFGVEFVTEGGHRLKGLMTYQQEEGEGKIEMFDKRGVGVGLMSFSLKMIKTIEIQTVEMMQDNDCGQNNLTNVSKYDKNGQRQSRRGSMIIKEDISMVKSSKEGTSKLTYSDYLVSKQQPSQLDNDIYFKKKWEKQVRGEQDPPKIQMLQKSHLKRQTSKDSPKMTVSMNNQAYLNQSKVKKQNFRKNKFELPQKQQLNEPQIMKTQPPLIENSSEAEFREVEVKEEQKVLVVPVTFHKEENPLKPNTLRESVRKVSFPLKPRKQEDSEEEPLSKVYRRRSTAAVGDKSTVRFNTVQNQNDLGVNTDRIGLVNNVFQSSYIPAAVPKLEERSGSKEQFEQEEVNLRGSQRNSGSNQFINVQTKYSMKTIQPSLFDQKLSFIILTVSVDYQKPSMGELFLKIYIPNKYYFETEPLKHSHSLTWQCKGLVFYQVQQQEDLFIDLFQMSKKGVKIIGKSIVSCFSFRSGKNQKIIRTFLFGVERNQIQSEDHTVGEVVLTFKNAFKHNDLTEKNTSERKQNQTAHISQSQPSKALPERVQLDQEDPPIQSLKKNKSSKKRCKTKSTPKGGRDSLTQLLKVDRKQKMNRYIINEYSRADIGSRINPIRQKRYAGGRNIAIGKDVRFPLSYEEEQNKNVPGPESYSPATGFKRYKNEDQHI